eukprot:3136308-Rhodomonas_salina.1
MLVYKNKREHTSHCTAAGPQYKKDEASKTSACGEGGCVDMMWGGLMGRAFMGDATEAAAKVGVDLALSLVYSLGDAASIEDAVSRLAQSGVGIVLCTIFHSDLLSIAYAADSHGLLGDGFAWIVPHAVPVDAVAAQSPDPARARAVLQGWLASSSGLLRGAAGEAFYTVLANEPLENLNVSGLQGLVTPGLLQELSLIHISEPTRPRLI